MSESREQLERRSEAAFAASPWRDPRGEYRALLKRLRERDAAAFEDAVAAYESEVASRLADESADPIAAWLAYGRRLAQVAGGGRTMRIDEEGRAEEATDTVEPARPVLMLHLPADESAAAFIVAAPREPSAAQRAAVALLADGAQALPR